jgi:hypothetical protein
MPIQAEFFALALAEAALISIAVCHNTALIFWVAPVSPSLLTIEMNF